jgi:hypothetical protein
MKKKATEPEIVFPNMTNLQASIDHLMALHAKAELLHIECWLAMDVVYKCNDFYLDPCEILCNAAPGAEKARKAIWKTIGHLQRAMALTNAKIMAPVDYE